MNLGFETIGNATLICHDQGPVLVTDPWTEGSAYFGSWILQHEIPAQQLADIRACKYVWLSHGHPDHLSLESLEHLRHADILLADHYGERIHQELRAAGFRTWILKDGHWTQLSPRIRVMSIANIFQDAVLLVDLGGKTLVVNANDAGDRGGGFVVKREVSRFEHSFLLALVSYGDADMINMFDDSGQRIRLHGDRPPLQGEILTILDAYGIQGYVPFATLHQYQRSDSIWANEHVVGAADFAPRNPGEAERLLPPYVSYDSLTNRWTRIDPAPIQPIPRDPGEFGDDWAETLQPGDAELLETYFRRFEHLPTFLGWIEFVVGGQTLRIEIEPRHPRGVRFETPRASLIKVIEWQVFDDLMIGNFTKTTLIGDWKHKNTLGLYPDLDPFITKFGDNGLSHTKDELRRYFAEYLRRGYTSFDGRPESEELAQALAPYLP